MEERSRDETTTRPGSEQHELESLLVPRSSAASARRDVSSMSSQQHLIPDDNSMQKTWANAVTADAVPSDHPHQRGIVNPIKHTPAPWHRWQNIWIWEYCIAFFSVGCMCAIGIILAAMHDRPLARWPLPISPNALISIFATISKSAMLLALAEGICQLKWVYFRQRAQKLRDFQIFDEASRGPWGALKLLSRINIRAGVASIGALIVVLSLAMDPFVQQILRYRTDMVVANNVTATIGSATIFDSGAGSNPLDSSGGDKTSFEQYPITMASSDLINSLARGLFNSKTNTAYGCPTGNCTWPSFDTLGVCSTCTPMNASAACGYQCQYKSYSPDPYGLKERLYTFANASATGCETSTFATIAIVSHSDDAKSWEAEPAYSCDLSFCRRTYSQSSFSEGVLYDDPTASEPLVPYPHATLHPLRKNSTYLCPLRTEEDAKVNATDSTVYWINDNDISVVGAALEPLFWSTLLTTLGANNYVASALYRQNNGTIPRTIEAVAVSMTNQIRQGPNATQIIGTALMPEVYIRVAWFWLILPTGLVLFAVAFLTVTMALSAGKSQVVWKSSSLATLFQSMHGMHAADSELRSVRSFWNAAEERHALLRGDDDGRVGLVYANNDAGRKTRSW